MIYIIGLINCRIPITCVGSIHPVDYRSREPDCITSMLHQLNLPTIQQRWKIDQLVYNFTYSKSCTVPATNADKYFVNQRAKRSIAIDNLKIYNHLT